jgi:hypothetical protein
MSTRLAHPQPRVTGGAIEEAARVTLIGVPQFERFFRTAAGLDVDKNDLKRYDDFVNERLRDLLLVAQDAAGANGRDVIEFWDLPVTKGLQERMHEFQRLDQDIELAPILGRIAAVPYLDRALSEETQSRLPDLVGGLSVALARAFTIIDTDLRNPSSHHWERASQLFNLVL